MEHVALGGVECTACGAAARLVGVELVRDACWHHGQVFDPAEIIGSRLGRDEDVCGAAHRYAKERDRRRVHQTLAPRDADIPLPSGAAAGMLEDVRHDGRAEERRSLARRHHDVDPEGPCAPRKAQLLPRDHRLDRYAHDLPPCGARNDLFADVLGDEDHELRSVGDHGKCA